MQSNRGRDTRPELRLRSQVHALGLRYRVDAQPLPGLRRRADMVFRGARVAVFLDGCFWHGCPEHYTAPAANRAFWAEKVAANVARDRETDRVLAAAGWTVLRFWEHDEPTDAAAVVKSVVTAGLAAPGKGSRPGRRTTRGDPRPA
jgi:DNA mismatch endonuclease (patch repair protein)